jgi:hypothetical protein
MFILWLRFPFVTMIAITLVGFSLLAQAQIQAQEIDDPLNNSTANAIAPTANTASLNSTQTPSTVVLPPLGEGVSELAFNEFFTLPIGPRGLEPTKKLLRLNNKRVRVVGYMTKDEEPTPGIFMLAAHSVNVAEKADGVADDLPAATLFVHMPAQDKDKALAYRPTPWVLTGTLQLGNKAEANGRVSYVRLIMEQGDIDVEQKKNSL